MIDLNTFITSLKIEWLSRAYKDCNDNWKYDLLDYFNFNPEGTEHDNDAEIPGRVLSNIINSAKKFKKSFSEVGNNFLYDRAFFNDKFGYGRRLEKKFDADFLGPENMNAMGNQLKNMKWLDLLDETGEFFAFNQFRLETGIELDLHKYQKIQGTFAIFKKRYFKASNKGFSLNEFLLKDVKGSKRYRNILEVDKRQITIQKLPQVSTWKKKSRKNKSPGNCNSLGWAVQSFFGNAQSLEK